MQYYYFLIIFLFSCSHINTNKKINLNTELKNRFLRSEREKIKEIINQVFSNDYKEASLKVNKMLKFDPKNDFYHFLNGVIYHQMAIKEDRSNLSYAIEGYKQALKLNNYNPSYSYFLGLAYYGDRNYLEAQQNFEISSYEFTDNYEVFSYLARSAYMNGKLKIADNAITKSFILAPENKKLEVLKDQIIIKAGKGDFIASEKKRQEFIEIMAKNKLEEDEQEKEINFLDRRIKRFKEKVTQGLNYVQFGGGSSSKNILGNDSSLGLKDDKGSGSYGGSNNYGSRNNYNSNNSGSSTQKKKIPRMVMVDVVIIRSEERKGMSNGVNLFNGLNLQLSSTPLSYNSSVSGTNVTKTTTRSVELSSSQINYNLNIFNDNFDHNEVIARPTILATDGKKSEFFSGSVLHVAIKPSSGEGEANIESLPIGIKLSVKPNFLSGNKIALDVDAARAFIENRSTSSSFDSFTQTSKTHIKSKVVMNFGQTAIISGLSEHEEGKVIDRVPFLGQIPILKTFFSNENKQIFHRSILILLTPRRVKTYSSYNKKTKKYKYKNKSINPLMKNNLKSYLKDRSILNLIQGELEDTKFFKPFRQGDMNTIKWNSPDSLKRWFFYMMNLG